jgi:NTE family protein
MNTLFNNSSRQKRQQRAIIFQGGGALGAYETGVFKEIFKKVKRDDEKKACSSNYNNNNNNNNALFDIIAGTSIGAINATLLVGYFLKNNRSWEGSSEKLIDFWEGLMSMTLADILIEKNPFICEYWNYLHAIDRNIADAESARRFWSIFQFAFTLSGVPNMYFSIPHWNYKFLNPFDELLPWWRYDYEPLRTYLSKFVDFPIKTSFEKGEPRLLLVSMDIQDYRTAVVFDSYKKQHDAMDLTGNPIAEQEWFSEYGYGQTRHAVFYDGIGSDQVLASTLGKHALNHPLMEDRISKTQRMFWDGGYHSNTPLRQLIHNHRKYWYESGKKETTDDLTCVPDLEVYIVNLHPSVLEHIPTDKNSINDREQDILFQDRTNFDEYIAYIVSDYVDLIGELATLARSNGLADDVSVILNKAAKGFSRGRGELKKYKDLIAGRFNINKIWRIDRAADLEDIFGKTTDFSPTSIKKLIVRGENDARFSLNHMEILFGIQDSIDDGMLSHQEGTELIEKTIEVTTSIDLDFEKKKRLINNLHKFTSQVNEMYATKSKLSQERAALLINSANTIIIQLEQL